MFRLAFVFLLPNSSKFRIPKVVEILCLDPNRLICSDTNIKEAPYILSRIKFIQIFIRQCESKLKM